MQSGTKVGWTPAAALHLIHGRWCGMFSRQRRVAAYPFLFLFPEKALLQTTACQTRLIRWVLKKAYSSADVLSVMMRMTALVWD